MKVRMFVGLSVLAVVVAALAFSAKTFRATAQDKPLPPPPIPVFPHGVSPSRGVIQATAPAPAPQPSLPEMIANLKELRKQEQQLTRAIREKIKAEKKSLDDAENELKSLGIDPPSVVLPKGVPAPVPAPVVPTCTTNYKTKY